jgi:hypothetical protein
MKTIYWLDFNPKKQDKSFCFHWSIHYIKSWILKPNKWKCTTDNIENKLTALYASDQASICISMSILKLPWELKSGLKSHEFPHWIIYEGKPQMKNKIYIYKFEQSLFHQQINNSRQRVAYNNLSAHCCYVLDATNFESYFKHIN